MLTSVFFFFPEWPGKYNNFLINPIYHNEIENGIIETPVSQMFLHCGNNFMRTLITEIADYMHNDLPFSQSVTQFSVKISYCQFIAV